jgi:hypothetical protein
MPLRAEQKGKPLRLEAIRRLLELALAIDAGKPPKKAE